MRRALRPHPATPCPAVERLEVEVSRVAGVLSLRYRLEGRLPELVLPAAAVSERADELWRTTCFEAFGRGDGAAYSEFNLSPSGRWAAYAFSAYRAGMAQLETPPPAIAITVEPTRLELAALIRPPEARRLALCAVIETIDGRISYWGLAHPPGKPDFHHRDCFALELPAPEAP